MNKTIKGYVGYVLSVPTEEDKVGAVFSYWQQCENKRGREIGLKGRKLALARHGKGYHRVSLSKDGKVKKFLLHRLIAQAYLENPNKLAQVNHKNDNPSDNRLSNIYWGTHIENQKDMRANGIRVKKIRQKALTNAQFAEIRLSIVQAVIRALSVFRINYE